MSTTKNNESSASEVILSFCAMGLSIYIWLNEGSKATLNYWCQIATCIIFLFTLSVATFDFIGKIKSRPLETKYSQYFELIAIYAMISPVAGYYFVSTIFGIFYILDNSMEIISKISAGGRPAIYGTISLILFGIFAFAIRLSYRSTYGAIEFIVGVVIIHQKIVSEMLDHGKFGTEFGLTVLTAGLFLIVRGLDNIHQGHKSDKIIARLRAIYNR